MRKSRVPNDSALCRMLLPSSLISLSGRGEDAEPHLRASNEGSPRPRVVRATEVGVLAPPLISHESERIARIIHNGSSRNRAVAWRDGHVEPGAPEAYLNSTSRERAASLPAEGASQQRIRDCSRSAHESCGLVSTFFLRIRCRCRVKEARLC